MEQRRADFSGVLPDREQWRGRRVLITGHTGFKGSWLSWWLSSMGAEVFGLALDPPSWPSLFALAELSRSVRDVRGDVRDVAVVTQAVRDAQPDIVFHLAAQSLVRQSYRDPLGTFATNVMGTANVLEAVRAQEGVRAVVVASSDKCYRNDELGRAFVESDSLGGHDAYAASKAGTEHVVEGYRSSFFANRSTLIASVRAGNVIGGGDWADDRLVPDLVRARASGQPIRVRNPTAIRPWQHVLEPLCGYIVLAERLHAGDHSVARAFNFGPGASSEQTVETLLSRCVDEWGDRPEVVYDRSPQPHEAGVLRLDAGLAHRQLGWQPRWHFATAVERTAAWYAAVHASASVDTVRAAMSADLTAYCERRS